MQNGRGYRYFSKPVLYPFGFGLSYTSFKYSNLSLGETRLGPTDNLEFTFDAANVGGRPGDEVVEVYLTTPQGPRWALKAFRKETLVNGEQRSIHLALSEDDLKSTLQDGSKRVVAGDYTLWVGGRQPTGHGVS